MEESKSAVTRRIKLLREDMKMSQDEFIERLSFGKRTLAGYEAGEQFPNKSKIIHICDMYNVDNNWLLNPLYYDDEPIPYIEDAKLHQVVNNFDLVPVHHRQNINGAGGYGAINEDESAEIIMVSEQMLRAMFGLSTFENLDIINVTGNSMKPIVEDGDTIMVRRTNEVKNNQIAIVRVADQLYIKYFQRHPLGKWIKLSSEDKENYPDMDFEGQEVNEVQVIGLLIGKFKPY